MVFTLWKLHGHTQVTKFAGGPYISLDGKVHQLDLLTGRSMQRDGDLAITVGRDPLIVRNFSRYMWSATIEMQGGGFAPYDRDIEYPNEAPVDGYQPQIVIEMPVTATHWSGEFDHSYYFKKGPTFGRITFHIFTGFDDPPVIGVGYTGCINPEGSRNLEIPGSDAPP